MGADLMQTTLASVKQTLTPLSTFYYEYTSPQSLGSPDDPCDKLRSMLNDLKNSDAKLQAEVRLISQNQGMKNAPSTVPTVPLSFGPGLHHTQSQSSSANVTLSTVETNIQNLQAAASGQAAHISKLERALHDVIRELPSNGVQIGTHQFNWKDEWSAFFELKMKSNNVYGVPTPPHLYASIVDGFTLMCLAHHDPRTVKENLDVEKGVNACKYESPACVTYKLSLQEPLPPQLSPATKDKSKVIDKRVLGSFKSHADFDTLCDHTSFKSHLIKLVQSKAMELMNFVRNTSLEGIIQETVQSASTFVVSLFTWIATSYQALEVQMGPGLGPDNWKFICHAVRAIFDKLYSLRRGGGESCDKAGQF